MSVTFDVSTREWVCTVCGCRWDVRHDAPKQCPQCPSPLLPTFATVIDDIWRRRFTGRFHVDCQSGVPYVIEFPQEPERIRLDTARKDAQSYEATVESR